MGQPRAAGPLSAGAPEADDSAVALTTLASIVASQDGVARSRHGVARADPVFPAGHYRRRPAAAVDTAELLPSESIFRMYIDSRFQGFGPIRRFVLRDALVTDQGAVVTRGGALLDESCWEFLTHRHVPHGLVREDAETFRRTEAPSLRVAPPSLLLKRPWWRNYGHWLIDAAALLALLVARGVGGFEQIVIGAAEDAKLQAIFRETLACIAPGIPVVEHPDAAVWAFAELHYVQPVRRPPMFALPAAVEALRVAVLGPDAPAPGDRRLFVSRRHYAGRRRLANEAEIMGVCERHGFEVVFPEQLGLREQALLFRSAAAILGVKGAGLTNGLFAPADAAMIVLSPGDFADPFFWDIAGARGMAYAEIFGRLADTERVQAHNPFTIDPDRLDRLLRAVLPPPRPPPRPPVVTEAPVPVAAGVVPPALGGASYLSCLADIHARTQPRTYLEIGTLNGKTLALSRCPTIAIDPAFRLAETVPGAMPSLLLFQGSSDAFFETVDPKAVLGGPIDLAFLDGMHLFEFLLRDFINTERHCHRGSMVVLHDCIPLDLEMTGRDMQAVQSRADAKYPGWWTGDVWKTVAILKRHRPDLDIVALDAPPTGLIVVRGLDPASTALAEGYHAIVEAQRREPEEAALTAYLGRLDVRGTSTVEGFGPILRPGSYAPNP